LNRLAFHSLADLDGRTVSPELVNAFSKALRQFKQTGEFRAIFQRYFPGATDGSGK
jgi:ABC-type amino acid transport substrate-binding protein